MLSTRIPYAPMLVSAADPERRPGEWSVEMKWDGVRAIVEVDEGAVRIWSRRGNDVTRSFPDVAADLGLAVADGHAVLDGEIVVLGADNRPDFSMVQRRLGTAGRRIPPASLLLFDILARDHNELISAPYDERRRVLESALLQQATVVVPPVFTTDVEEGRRLSRQHGIEGIVCKRPTSPYLPGKRGLDWVKVTTVLTVEAVVIGFTRGAGGRLGSLVLGVPTAGGDLRYAGRVSSGLTGIERQEWEQLLPLHAIGLPAATDAVAEGDVTWTEPRFVVDVAMSQWTKDGRMRHPRWRGVRLDRSAADITPS